MCSDTVNRDPINSSCICKDGYYEETNNPFCIKCDSKCTKCQSNSKNCITCNGKNGYLTGNVSYKENIGGEN